MRGISCKKHSTLLIGVRDAAGHLPASCGDYLKLHFCAERTTNGIVQFLLAAFGNPVGEHQHPAPILIGGQECLRFWLLDFELLYPAMEVGVGLGAEKQDRAQRLDVADTMPLDAKLFPDGTAGAVRRDQVRRIDQVLMTQVAVAHMHLNTIGRTLEAQHLRP